MTLAPSGLAFNAQLVGTTSAPQLLRLTNNSATAVSITSISVGDLQGNDFAQTNNCPASLNPQTGCTISVTLSPVNSGALNGTLAVTGAASSVSTVLTGFGSQPQPIAKLSPSSLSFNGQIVGTNSVPTNLIVTNESTAAPLTIFGYPSVRELWAN